MLNLPAEGIHALATVWHPVPALRLIIALFGRIGVADRVRLFDVGHLVEGDADAVRVVVLGPLVLRSVRGRCCC